VIPSFGPLAPPSDVGLRPNSPPGTTHTNGPIGQDAYALVGAVLDNRNHCGRRFLAVVAMLAVLAGTAKTATLAIDKDQFFVVDGQRVVSLFFMLAPPPYGRTPSGADAWRD
jgi:hypothetical protein